MSAAPAEVQLPSSDESVDADRPWIVIVWNDPINLMSYVVLVFQKLFGYNRAKAASRSFGACFAGSREFRRTTPKVRPFRRATPTKQRPAANV